MITERDIPWTVTDVRAEDKIDMNETLNEIVTTILRYVVMTREQAIALALWIVHTHAFDAAECTPYQVINSAAKRSGKTTLLELLALLVRRPWLTGKVSAAVLVRKTDAEQPTLLLDESDATFNQDTDYSEALRGLLNSGYRRSGVASLCVGQGANITYKDFSTFCPKAIAGIGKLPDTVMDRAIVITLKRRARTETVSRFRERAVREHTEPIRNRVAAWAQANLADLRGRQPRLPDELSDRAQDVWEPLLAIADNIGGDWSQLARKAAVVLSGAVDDDDVAVQLLGDCQIVFKDANNPETMSSKSVVEALVAMEDRAWSTWSGGRPITQSKVTRMLHGFGIDSHDIKVDGKTLKRYTRREFQDAWSRYLPSDPPSPGSNPQLRYQPNKYGPESAFSEAQPEASVADSRTQETSINTGLCSGVAEITPARGGNGQSDTPRKRETTAHRPDGSTPKQLKLEGKDDGRF